ncbi:MAG: hypothetical protein WA952_11355 [Lewinella sp.]
MLFPTLLTALLVSLSAAQPVKVDFLVNEFSQPNAYQLDIRLEPARSQDLTICISHLIGITLPERVTDKVVAEADGVNLTYLPEHNHLALLATDYTQASADRARSAGQEMMSCLELFPVSEGQ